jgi:hypothetical protein
LHKGEQRYTLAVSITSRPLYPGEQPLVSNEYEAGWDLRPVQAFLAERTNLPSGSVTSNSLYLREQRCILKNKYLLHAAIYRTAI